MLKTILNFAWKSGVTCLLVGLLGQAQAQYSPNPRLGSNVGSLDKMTSSIPFNDIFKLSSGWFTSCEFDWQRSQPIDPGCTRQNAFNTREQAALDLDGSGWVRSLPRPNQQPIFTSVTSTWKMPESFPTGAYVVLYEGQGRFKLQGDVSIVSEQPGRTVFNLNSPKRNLRLNISAVTPGNHIRNLRIVPADKEATHQRQIFNPEYIKRVRPFHSMRFMPWSNPRGNDAVNWNERAKLGQAHYTGPKGVPAERMIDLANAAQTSPWISVPYKASDDYMRQYARMVKNRLRPNAKVYLEYSNEMWNIIFPGTTYAARKADALWNHPYKDKPSYQRRVSIATNWYAKRTVEMCRIWKREFGNQAGRVVCILSAQSAATWVGKETLDCPLWKEAGGCGRHVDAFAIGPYFGDYIARKEHRPTVKSWLRDPDGGMNRLFTEIERGGMLGEKGPVGGAVALTTQQYVQKNVELARKYNLPLMAYEAGQHLIRFDPPHTVKDPQVLNLFMQAQKHPRMRSAYQRYLNAWNQATRGGLLMHYYGVGTPSKKNFFSMLDHTQQQSTPKYQALMDYLGSRVAYTPPPASRLMPVANRRPAAPAPVRQVARAPAPAPVRVVRQQPAPVPQQQRAQPARTTQQDLWNQAQMQLLQQPAQTTLQAEAYQNVPVYNNTSVARAPAPARPAAPAPVPAVSSGNQYPAPIQSNVVGLGGPGVANWTKRGNLVTSPPIRLKRGARNELSVLWQFVNLRLTGREYFHIFAIDSRGGRKLLMKQTIKDIREVGEMAQIYVENIGRYVGPPIRLQLEVSPGLNAVVENVAF